MKKMTVVSAALVAAFAAEAAVTSRWTGAESGSWTNAANWTAGVPGQYVASDGTAAGETGCTAVFASVEQGASTTINLDGLVGIKNITITGASAPQYTFGTKSAQNLPMEGWGGKLLVESSVVNLPVLTCSLGLGLNVETGMDVYLENNSSETLSINNFGYFTKTVSGTPTINLHFSGSGTVRLAGSAKETGSMYVNYKFLLDGLGRLEINTSSLSSLTRLTYIDVPADRAETNVVRIASGCTILVNTPTAVGIHAAGNLRFEGEGTLSLRGGYYLGSGQSGTSDYSTHSTGIQVESGRTIEFASILAGKAASGSAMTNAKCGMVVSGQGRVVLSGENTIPGRVDVIGSGVAVEVPSLGLKGEASSLGTWDAIRISGNSRLVFTGVDGTTDRILELGQATSKGAVLEHAGSGTLTFASSVTQLAANITLDLRNNTANDAVFSGNLRDNPHSMNVVKSGSGRWILTGANTYSGTTSINGGTLRLSSGGSLSSTVQFADGTALEAVAGTDGMSGTLSLAAPVSGTATLSVEGGGQVTVASLASGAGVLNVVLGEGASVAFSGVSAGNAPSYLTLNGDAAAFDENGCLVARDNSLTDEIPARGGVIPNGADKSVGITSAGTSGPITLQNGASAEISLLKQAVSTDATVSLYGGLSLTLAHVLLAESAASLTIGSEPGEGYLMPSSGGMLELENNETDSVLTVNAALSVPAAATLVKRGVGPVRTTAGFDCAGNLVLVDGMFAVSNGAAPSASISGLGTLRKEGDGSWTLSTAQNEFSGDFILAGGYNFMTANGVFGNDTGRLFVTNGTTLDLSSVFAGSSGSVRFGGKEVVISGDGFNGMGALRYGRIGEQNNSAGTASAAFGRLTLADDATICYTNTSGGMGVSGSAVSPAIFNMNGHTLLKRGRGTLRFEGGMATNPGPIRVEADETGYQSTIFLANFDLGGDATTPLFLGDKATLMCDRFLPQSRALVVDGSNARTTCSSSSHNLTTNVCNWTGPVVLTNNLSVELRSLATDPWDFMVTFSGPVSGPSGIVVSAKSRLFLAGGSNSFGGQLVLNGNNGGTLAARAPGSIPDVSKVVVNDGRLAVCAPYWTASGIATLAAGATFMTGYSYLAVNTADCDGQSWAFAPGDTLDNSGIAHEGPGTLTVTGPITDAPRYANFGGTLKFTGPEEIVLGVGALCQDPNETNDATVVFEDAADVRADAMLLGCNWCDAIGVARSQGRVVVKNSLLRRKEFETSGSVGSGIRVGYTGQGVLVLEQGACVTNLLAMGVETGSRGALYMRGGELCDWSTGPSSSDLGTKGSAYLEISGGRLVCGHGIAGLARQPAGRCVMDICGGEVVNTGVSVTQSEPRNFYVGRAGRAHLRVKKGRFDSPNAMFVCEQNVGISGANGVITVEDDGEFICGSIIYIGAQSNSTATLNLNGGEFSALYVRGSVSSYAGSTVCINADGGTYRLLSSVDSIFRDVTRVTVNGGGLAVDTYGFNGAIDVPLCAPSGNGVTAIPSGWWGVTNYVGSPYVEIVGSGHGATAYAEFDSVAQAVTSVRVTSPGYGYGNDTVAVLHWGGLEITNAVSTGPISGGGFTKKGEGMLTLSATNTYAGATVVEKGTLKLGCDWAIPSNSAVVVSSGATLDANGVAFFPGSLSGGGTIAGGVTMPAEWTLDMADVTAGKHAVFSGEVSFPAGARLVLRNANLADDAVRRYVLAEMASVSGELPTLSADDAQFSSRWKLAVSGGKLKLVMPKGYTISFK